MIARFRRKEHLSLPSSSTTTAAVTTASRFLSLLCLLGFVNMASAQLGGICACSPSVYEFTLDFSLTCDDVLLPQPGIEEFECSISAFQPGANVDLTPVVVLTIDVLEFDQDLQLNQQTSLFDEYQNGAEFNFISGIGNPQDVTATTIPKALQVSIIASNAQDQPLLMLWIISFTNSCDQWPVFRPGDRIGWTVFRGFAEPDAALCPLSAGITNPPTFAPSTVAPTAMPTPEVMTPRPTLMPQQTPRPTSSPIEPSPRPSNRPVSTPQPTPSPTCPRFRRGKGVAYYYDPYYYGKGMMGKGMMKDKKMMGYYHYDRYDQSNDYYHHDSYYNYEYYAKGKGKGRRKLKGKSNGYYNVFRSSTRPYMQGTDECMDPYPYRSGVQMAQITPENASEESNYDEFGQHPHRKYGLSAGHPELQKSASQTIESNSIGRPRQAPTRPTPPIINVVFSPTPMPNEELELEGMVGKFGDSAEIGHNVSHHADTDSYSVFSGWPILSGWQLGLAVFGGVVIVILMLRGARRCAQKRAHRNSSRQNSSREQEQRELQRNRNLYEDFLPDKVISDVSFEPCIYDAEYS